MNSSFSSAKLQIIFKETKNIVLRFQDYLFLLFWLFSLYIQFLKYMYIYIVREVRWCMQICPHLDRRLKNSKCLERQSGKREITVHKDCYILVTVSWFTLLNSTQLTKWSSVFLPHSSVFLQKSAFSCPMILFCSACAI